MGDCLGCGGFVWESGNMPIYLATPCVTLVSVCEYNCAGILLYAACFWCVVALWLRPAVKMCETSLLSHLNEQGVLKACVNLAH